MMMAIGLSQYNVALMHTVNHAFFKALLFLGAGAVIHSFADEQDIRKMGGLIKFLPFTYSVMLTGSLSLLATPYLTGFYSKDLILELAYGQYNFSGIYAYILGSITAGITAFYSFRLISLVFLTTPNGNKQSYINSCPPSHLCEATPFEGGSKSHRQEGVLAEKLNLIVIFPLLLLALFSIFFGFAFSDLFVGMGSDFFKNSIFMHPKNISLIEAEFSLSFGGPLMEPLWQALGPLRGGETSLSQVNNIFIKLLPAILSFTGAFSAFILYHLQHPILPHSPRAAPGFFYLYLFKSAGPLAPLGFYSYFNNTNKKARDPLPKRRGEREAPAHAKASPDPALVAQAHPAEEEGLFLINLTNNKIGKNIYAFLNGKYFFDVIYNHFFIQRGLNLGYNISKEIDRGAIELLGPYGLSNYFYNAGKNLAKLDTGVITTYSLYITIALISLLFILFYHPASPPIGEGGGEQSFEEIRLIFIYITSALIVLSPYPPVFLSLRLRVN
jgi:NADH:ubiquinone oxidoreductase subunit 5 (subunit L)/multisubunit Na+/H+ antiporter MnhA subunit